MDKFIEPLFGSSQSKASVTVAEISRGATGKMTNSCSITQGPIGLLSVTVTLYIPGGKLFLTIPAEGSSNHDTVNGATPPTILIAIRPSSSPEHDIWSTSGSSVKIGASKTSISYCL